MGEIDFQREVLRQLSILGERTARIEAGQEERCKARGEAMDDLKACQEDHEDRIRKIETTHAEERGKQVALAGVGAAVGGALVAGADLAWKVWGTK